MAAEKVLLPPALSPPLTSPIFLTVASVCFCRIKRRVYHADYADYSWHMVGRCKLDPSLKAPGFKV